MRIRYLFFDRKVTLKPRQAVVAFFWMKDLLDTKPEQSKFNGFRPELFHHTKRAVCERIVECDTLRQ